ncbi:phage tail fiber protein [Pragia fontium]|uniref:phage tail fiber protein n=1 Tax=Pragia fontium TaxID=82985 RepID=UPI000F6C2DC5|nr:phage tail protein [Pragia fontium]VEJ54658.1 Uncharacterised protein [Pragia fontium]
MSSGTINLTNNSDIVVGTGTSFSTNLKAGDMVVAVVGGVTYTLPVKSIESDTALTIIKAYGGPTLAGNAWAAIPRDTMNAITAQLAAETAKALRGLNYDKDNWQKVFSDSGNITVQLPDGTVFTGPSWNNIAASVNNKQDKLNISDVGKNLIAAQNESSARTVIGSASDSEVLKKANNLSEISTTEAKKAARESLGLGSAAVLDAGTSNGELMKVGDTQNVYHAAYSGGSSAVIPQSGFLSAAVVGPNSVVKNLAIKASNSSAGWTLHSSFGFYVDETNNPNSAAIILTCTDGGAYTRNWFLFNNGNLLGPGGAFWGATNTAVDANGFIKRASPVVKLFSDGSCELNNESKGVTAERLSEGVYRLSGSLMGFNSDGLWDIEVPSDDNKQPLIWVKSTVEASGDIIVKTYHRTHPNAPKFAQNTIDGYNDGDPIDIPVGRWLDLRVQVYSNDL